MGQRGHARMAHGATHAVGQTGPARAQRTRLVFRQAAQSPDRLGPRWVLARQLAVAEFQSRFLSARPKSSARARRAIVLMPEGGRLCSPGRAFAQGCAELDRGSATLVWFGQPGPRPLPCVQVMLADWADMSRCRESGPEDAHARGGSRSALASAVPMFASQCGWVRFGLRRVLWRRLAPHVGPRHAANGVCGVVTRSGPMQLRAKRTQGVVHPE